MIGTIKWNVIVGAIGLLLTMVFSLNHNVFMTSVIRGAYVFAVLFIITFFMRWFLFYIVNHVETVSEAQKGAHIDLSTPEQDVQQQFSPLNPPTYETKEDIEEVVKVVRHMSED